MDDDNIAAVFYGPYLLAAIHEEQDYLETTLTQDNVKQRLKPAQGTLLFYDEMDQLLYRPSIISAAEGTLSCVYTCKAVAAAARFGIPIHST